LESIERFVTEQLASWEVPGCAIAAVQDGQTVLTAGWGRRDLDTGVPVTSDTLFAIGSVTKAFTAATVGALVDDGLLEFELDETGAVARLVAQPLGIFLPKT
jgi:CubicO group peptidase (beta-lactamase class C family)